MALGVKDRVNMLGASGEGFSAQTIAAIIGSSVSDVISVLTSPAAAPADPFGAAGAVALVSSANTYTQTQTFNTTSTRKHAVQDGSGNDLAVWLNTAGAGHFASQLNMYGDNAPGPAGAAWYVAVDASAATPRRDFAIGKFNFNGSASDPDGIYISNGGAGNPATVGIGVAQPADSGNLFRAKIAAPGSGTANPNPTMGALQIPWQTGQTGDMLAVGSSNDSQTAFRVRSDGTLFAHASSNADKVAADGVTNGTTTISSATIGLTADDVGRYVTGSIDIPAGAYLTAVNVGAQTATLSTPATGSHTGVTLTLLGRAYQFRTNGNAPLLTIGSNGSGATNAAFAVNLGVGTMASTNPTTTLDVAMASGAASLSVRQASGGNLRFLTSSTDVQGVTQNSTALRFGTNGIVASSIDTSQNVIVGPGAKATPAELATTATDGFLHIPTCNGVPTGVPAHTYTGACPLIVNRVGSAGSRLYAYFGGAWVAIA